MSGSILVSGCDSRPPAVSRTLARDPVVSARESVAGSSAAPDDGLSLLARDEAADVRKAAASNRGCRVAVLAAGRWEW